MATEQMTTGQRIARARHRKGWDQATLAEKIGRSVSWLSKVENGRLPLDRMSVVGQLAEALGVEMAELTGQPYRHETDDLDSGHSAVPGLRLALQQATMPGGAALLGNREPRGLAELEANVRLAEQLRQDAKFTALGEVLPGIITDLLLITSGGTADRDRAEALMLRACHMARVSSNLLGHHDLGWTAVQRELVAAQQVGAPELVAAASWDLCGVWLHEAALDPAKNAELSALDQLEPYVGTGDDTIRALWGALHLRPALRTRGGRPGRRPGRRRAHRRTQGLPPGLRHPRRHAHPDRPARRRAALLLTKAPPAPAVPVAPPEAVMDLDCGEGRISWHLVKRGFTGPITGVDSSPSAMKAFTERFAPYDRAHFELRDATGPASAAAEIEHSGPRFPGVLGVLRERIWTATELRALAEPVGLQVVDREVATIDDGGAEGWGCDALLFRKGSV